MANAYDEIAYPSGVFQVTHPDRMAAQAAVFGLRPAPPERCRVLEIGAGDGSNLIPMALSRPRSRFVGFDLARSPILRGQSIIRELALSNVDLVQADILDADLGESPFDYIVANGVYSWTPEPVRTAMLRMIQRRLAPQGVAFVSYNALPGCALRIAMRDDLLFATRNVDGRPARVDAAMNRVQALTRPSPAGTPFQQLFHAAMAETAQATLGRSTASLAHDELSDTYHPVYLHAFNAHCAEHGLQILAEADAAENADWFVDPADEQSRADVVARAQRRDFDETRYFRQALLVRDTAPIDRRAKPERLGGLHIASRALRDAAGHFQLDGRRFEIADPVLAASLADLGTVWPATKSVSLVARRPDHLGVLMHLSWIGAVELQAAESSLPSTAGEQPLASPLPRLQARDGQTRLTTLRHNHAVVDDGFRELVAGLDGSRTHAEIARDMARRLGFADDDAQAPLRAMLDHLARMALLVR